MINSQVERDQGAFTTSIDSWDLPDNAVLYVTMGDEVRLQLVKNDQTVTTMEFDRVSWLTLNELVAAAEDCVILGKHWPVTLEVMQSNSNPNGPKMTQVITPLAVRLGQIGESLVRFIEIPFEVWGNIGYIWNHQRMVKEYE